MPVAYSYLRFSSPQQADGDSVRRQTQARADWLAGHPDATLDRSLKMTDAGRSAFRRSDWDTYALARFVDHVKAGRVEVGSYLLVENLDRLSREDAGAATELFLSLVNRGIVVVQLSPIVMEFRRPVNVQSLMFAIVELSRGNSESAAKSDRVGKAWARKQKEAGDRVVTRRLPSWIDYRDGRLILNRDKVKVVRRLFTLSRDGVGVFAIAKRLNEEGVPVLGRQKMALRNQDGVDPKDKVTRPVEWNLTTVHSILRSRAAIGDYVPYRCRTAGRKPQGEPVPGYFPPAVDAELFYAVQAGLNTRSRVGKGKRGKHVNLFAGLLVNARGGSITYRHHSTQKPLLIPVDAAEGKGVRWVSFPAGPFEDAVLSKLREVAAADVLPGGTEAGRRVESLAGQVAEADALLKLWAAKMDDPAIVDVVAGKLAELNGRKRELSARLAEAQREAASPVSEAWGGFRSLAELLAADPSDDLRARTRLVLRQAVDGVVCLFAGDRKVRLAAVQMMFRGGGRRDYLIVYRPTKPPTCRPYSAAEAGLAGDIDLREPEGVRRMEKFLADLTPRSGPEPGGPAGPGPRRAASRPTS